MINDKPPREADPKFELSYSPAETRYLPPEQPDGPIVGFAVADNGELLILLEGHVTLGPNDDVGEVNPKRTALLYNRGEWEAFIGGVKDHEFDHLVLGGIVKMRDSKNPDGPLLVFLADSFGEFLLAIKTGKYDPPTS